MELTAYSPWFTVLFWGMVVMGLGAIFISNMVSFFTNIGATVLEVILITQFTILPPTLYVMFTVVNGVLLGYSIVYILLNWHWLKDAR